MNRVYFSTDSDNGWFAKKGEIIDDFFSGNSIHTYSTDENDGFFEQVGEFIDSTGESIGSGITYISSFWFDDSKNKEDVSTEYIEYNGEYL